MSVHVIAEVRIAELDRFLTVFGGEGLTKRAEHGCRGATVLAPVDDPGRVLVLLEFPDVEHVEAFRADATARPIMAKGGAQGPPTFTVTERVATFEH